MFKHLPWQSHEGEKHPDSKVPNAGEDEESLTSSLSADQRSELTLLIASVMAVMRKTVESNFDASVSFVFQGIVSKPNTPRPPFPRSLQMSLRLKTTK